jgi:tricorn protease
MQRTLLCLLLLLSAAAVCAAQGPKPLLLRHPTLSRTQVAFVYGGDLWIVPREGGEARGPRPTLASRPTGRR